MRVGLVEKNKERLIKGIDIPEEVVLDLPKITIVGKAEITIENHRGIIKFEKDIIEVNSKIGKIIINGIDFEILYIGTYTLTISGTFKTIVYEV